MCRMKASLINIRLTSRYSAGSYAFAVKGLCALFSAFKIRSGTQFDGCADLYTLCREKSHTYLLLPQIVFFCNLPDSGRHVTSVFQGLSLSRSRGRVGENPGNEVVFRPQPGSLLRDAALVHPRDDRFGMRIFYYDLSCFICWGWFLFRVSFS